MDAVEVAYCFLVLLPPPPVALFVVIFLDSRRRLFVQKGNDKKLT